MSAKIGNKVDRIEFGFLFVSGFVALSTFANVVLTGLGIYLIEVLLLPILAFYYYKGKLSIGRRVKFNGKDFVLTYMLIISILIGIANTGNAFAVITCIRPFVYILIILKYQRDHAVELSLDRLYILALGCVIGDLIYTRVFSSLAVERGYQHINVMALALIIAIPMLKRSKVISTVNIAFALSVAMISGYRINMMICLVSVASCAILLLFTSTGLRSKLFYGVFIILILFSLFWVVDNFVYVSSLLGRALDMSGLAVNRTFERIAGLINGNYSIGDQNRLANFTRPLAQFWDSILPQGPIGKTNLSRFGEYTDIPMIFFYDVFGSFIGWIVVISYSIYMMKKAIVYINRRNAKQCVSQSNMLFLSMIPVVFTLVCLNGTFLTFVNISITFALALGGLVCDKEKCLYRYIG